MNDSLENLAKRIFSKNNLLLSGILFVFGFLFLILGIRIRAVIGVLGCVQMFAAVLLAAVGFVTMRRRTRQLTAALREFSFCSESATRAAVLNFPAPMAVTTIGGAIQWYNDRFLEMTGRKRENFFGEYIQDILPDLQFSRFVEDGDPSPEEYSFRDRNYIVTGRMVSVRQEEKRVQLLSIYFVDVSAQKQLLKQMEDKKIVVCAAVIDNYDEVIKSTPNSSHGSLVGQIEHCVNTWVDRGGGVAVRYERDKFMILFEAARFAPLMQEKFTILDEVKKVQQGNRIPATFSIGVGQSKDTLRENEQLAAVALEMALGRGGDQVVVKTAVGFQFYGAKSREVEKSTKVKARVVAHSLRDLAEQASRVIIMGHSNADADSLGAAVGLFRILRDKKVDVYIALDRVHNNVRIILDSLLEHDEYRERIIGETRALDLIDEKTLLIVVDTHRPSIVEYPSVLKNIQNVVLIDHHRRGEEFIEDTVLSYHEPYVSSSSEMVTELIPYIDSDSTMEPYEAEAIYSGIYLDTKGFTFKTGVRTFEAASYLRRLGVDPVNVKRLFRSDLNTYIQRSRIISHAKIYRSNIAIALCSERGADMQLVVAQAADELLGIRGIEAAFVLAADGNRIIISGRSLGSVNVQVILEKLGGGGHITIAGAQLSNNNLSLAEAELCSAIDEVVFEENRVKTK